MAEKAYFLPILFFMLLLPWLIIGVSAAVDHMNVAKGETGNAGEFFFTRVGLLVLGPIGLAIVRAMESQKENGGDV